jgi:hypothetical protein
MRWFSHSKPPETDSDTAPEAVEPAQRLEEEESAQARLLQRRADAGVAAAPPHGTFRQPAHSPGEPLPEELRQRLETRFAHDLTDVRIHTDDESAELARALGAEAVTTGRHIYFARGKYEPITTEGQRLLVHELTHTAQQAGTTEASAAEVQVESEHTPLEQEAERASDGWTAHGPIDVSYGTVTTATPQRQTAPCPDPTRLARCKELLGQIKQVVAKLIERGEELVKDPWGLQWDNWHTPKILPDGTNLGSVAGHQHQYEGWRTRLRNLLDEWQDDDCNNTGLRVPQEVRELAFKPAPEPVPRPRPETEPKPWAPPGAAPAPSPLRRVGAAATGALVGAAAGAVTGGLIGGVVGASGGTLVAPGAGTVGGGAAGVSAGVEAGAWLGAAVGTGIGTIVGWIKGA